MKTIYLWILVRNLYSPLTDGAYEWSKPGSYLAILKLYIAEEVYIWEVLQASKTPHFFFFSLVIIKSKTNGKNNMQFHLSHRANRVLHIIHKFLQNISGNT